MKPINKQNNPLLSDMLCVLLCILCVYGVVWAFTGMWPWTSNPYNSYSLQASRWLSGHLDLGQNYSHLELAQYHGRYFVSFPPFPSFVMLPFILLFGTQTPDGWIALIISIIGAFYTMKLLARFGQTGTRAIFWTLFLICGSNLLFVSVNGWVWFIAQNLCFTLTMMALYYAICGKGGFSLAFWACSVGCRPFQVIYLPILLYLLYRSEKERFPDRNVWQILRINWYICIAPCVIALIYMVLNYARFGSITEFGHNYLPEFQQAPLGQFHLSYIKENFPLLWKLPRAEEHIVQFPKFNGTAFYLVSPIFISYAVYFIYAAVKKRLSWKDAVIPCLILIQFLFITAHKTMGGYHFGNRYTNYALPMLFIALLFLMPEKDKLEKYQYPLCILGLAINIAGTIAVYNNWI